MKTVLEWIKKHWLGIAEGIGVIIAVLMGQRIIDGMLHLSGAAKVEKPNDFLKLENPHQVLVRQGGVWTTVQLPDGVTSDKVTAVQLDPNGPGKVEVRNEGINQV
jgi:hypothetical protein